MCINVRSAEPRTNETVDVSELYVMVVAKHLPLKEIKRMDLLGKNARIAFCGYGFAAFTGWIIYKLNEIFYPSYATEERLIAWVLILGTIFTLFLSDAISQVEKRHSDKEN